MDPRTLRQVLLPEIGPAGQARIGRAAAAVLDPGGGDPLAHDVAERYARGAGFAELGPGGIDVAALAPPALVASPAAGAVLAGARTALAELRAALAAEEVRA